MRGARLSEKSILAGCMVIFEVMGGGHCNTVLLQANLSECTGMGHRLFMKKR